MFFLLQWLFIFLFFRQSTDLIAYVPLFSTDFTRLTMNPAVTSSSPCFSQKLFRAFAKADETEGSPLPIFSALCDFFFDSFCLQRVPPSSFFDILQQTKVPKVQSVSPFMYFGTMRLFKILIFCFFFRKKSNKKINFFVSKGPFNLFDILQQTGFSKSPSPPLLQI